MRAKLIRIGNSQGVRIPKALIQETGLPPDVEIIADGNRLVIAPAHQPREGWEEAFRRMRAEDEKVLDGPVCTLFDKEEWEW
jgi:antitoxin MazE